MIWGSVCSAAALLLHDLPLTLDDIITDLPTIIPLLVIYALIPAVLLPTLSTHASFLTFAVYYYFDLQYFLFIPLSVVLIHARITPPLSLAIAVLAMYIANTWFYVAVGVLAVLAFIGVFSPVTFEKDAITICRPLWRASSTAASSAENAMHCTHGPTAPAKNHLAVTASSMTMRRRTTASAEIR